MDELEYCNSATKAENENIRNVKKTRRSILKVTSESNDDREALKV